MPIGRERERHRRVVARSWRSKREKSMLRRSSRGGVPVFSRPQRKPNDFSDSARSCDGGSPARPAGRCSRPDVNQAVEERAGGHDQRAAANDPPSSSSRPATRPPSSARILPALPRIQSNARLAPERGRHPRAVAPLVGLRARRPHRRTAAAVEQLELDAGRVDRAAHQSAERVDLADQMTLRRAADRRIARHVRDGVRPTACRCRRCSPGAPPPTPPRRRRARRRSR